MIKTYITMISSHTSRDLLKLYYHPYEFELKNNRETHFPIISIIADDYEKGDQVKVLAIRPDNLDSPGNFNLLQEELLELGIEKNCVKELVVEENQRAAVGLNLLMSILEEIPDDSVVRADITFGTKPMSVILQYALSFVEKLKDTEVEGIFYGEIPRENGRPVLERATIYDLTAYKVLGDVIDDIQELEIGDIQQALRRMMNL